MKWRASAVDASVCGVDGKHSGRLLALGLFVQSDKSGAKGEVRRFGLAVHQLRYGGLRTADPFGDLRLCES